MFLHLSVRHSVHGAGGGGCLPHCMLGYTVGQVHPLVGSPAWAGTAPGMYTPSSYTPLARQVPPQAGTPPGRYPPLHSACWDTVNKWAVHILLECNLVSHLSVCAWRSVFVKGGLCPWVSLCRGSLSRASLSSDVSAWGISVQWGFGPVDLCPTGSLSGRPPLR